MKCEAFLCQEKQYLITLKITLQSEIILI
jgi:hypothetical protein